MHTLLRFNFLQYRQYLLVEEKVPQRSERSTFRLNIFFNSLSR